MSSGILTGSASKTLLSSQKPNFLGEYSYCHRNIVIREIDEGKGRRSIEFQHSSMRKFFFFPTFSVFMALLVSLEEIISENTHVDPK